MGAVRLLAHPPSQCPLVSLHVAAEAHLPQFNAQFSPYFMEGQAEEKSTNDIH